MYDGMTWEEYCDYIDYLDSRACALNIPDKEPQDDEKENAAKDDSDSIPF